MPPKNLQKRQTSKLGKIAEDYAEKLLSKKGYKILDRNFHSRFGEIDIIAQDDKTLVFVEVKARWNDKYGKPEESVTPGKLWKIEQTGQYYSILNPSLPKKMRIDVVAIEIRNGMVSDSRIIKVF